ncbi:hypothetical protein SAMN05421780_101578 [Flexibacter flexilis DSM 6793]|uniref:ORC1/DEAH AAA+ ATPase domain-containing protein n=1 Tax=Flexibacter flexilis DSM 6793 TaxID=927664 RepID=A0A1I1E6W2_9BACT|nr:AAA family ATPase [Flexibacter flexilis]SFB81018.1 hypothetical protein SAMN05421780_101578 [Flexibacter flexilis DSM 6793]
MKLSEEFKEKVIVALMEQRENFGGSDAAYAKRYGISPAIYSRLKNGERANIIAESVLLNIGRELGIDLRERKWSVAETDVFKIISEDIVFCQQNAKARICVDDCGIGKTFSAKYLAKTRQNCFYVDASQAKTKQLFIRLLAKTIGIDSTGKYSEVKANLKYYTKQLIEPVIIIDEAGDLDYPAFLELKELWNATENACGWYLMGADGLRQKITSGIRTRKVGYRELFSRFSERYTTTVPTGVQDRRAFYKKLITDVLAANMSDSNHMSMIVNKCLENDSQGEIGGLRRAESLLLILENQQQNDRY